MGGVPFTQLLPKGCSLKIPEIFCRVASKSELTKPKTGWPVEPVVPEKDHRPLKYNRLTGKRVTGLTDLYVVFEEGDQFLQFDADNRPELPD